MSETSDRQLGWQTIVNRKRAERESKIPKAWVLPREVFERYSHRPISIFAEAAVEDLCPGILSRRELDLTSPTKSDATSLVKLLDEGVVTCVELTTAFCKRAAIAHQLTNCLTEIFFEQALERAHQIDNARSEGQRCGKLHGLPVTVKDSFHVKGFDSSIGISSLCDVPAETNSMLVDFLQASGAVIIAKTTVPQTMLTADTDSVVHGRTVNAYNNKFGASGSSGGEGVMLAMGGSPLGFGTDGAGSVRMPAFVNGVIGLRTSGYRWPLDGAKVLGDGIMGTTGFGGVSVAGPLCRSVRDAQLIVRLLSEAEPWTRNPFLLPSPWLGITLDDGPLRIGVWSSHDHVHLLPPVARGFALAQSRLEGAGQFKLSSFTGPSISRAWSLQKEWADIQDLRPLRLMTANEPITEIVRVTNILHPDKPYPPLDLDRLHSLNAEIAQHVIAMAKAWVSEDGQPLDALLWVPAPHPAVPFDQYTDLTFTGLFNMIDWPAITLPLGESVSAAEGDTSNTKKFADEVLYGGEDKRVQEMYFADAEAFEGLPLSVQLIGRRGLDEKLLAIAERVHKTISTK